MNAVVLDDEQRVVAAAAFDTHAGRPGVVMALPAEGALP
jgi:hypothetical protein